MQVRALVQCDAPGPPGKLARALFDGQVYELEAEVAAGLIEAGKVEAIEPVEAEPAAGEQEAEAPRRRSSRRRARS